MNKNFIKLFGILMIAVIAFATAACGGSSKEKTTSANEEVVTEAVTDAIEAVSEAATEEDLQAPKGNPAMAGSYKLTEMIDAGEAVNEEDISAMEQLGMYAMLIIKDDGNAVLNLFGMEMQLQYNDGYFMDKETDQNLDYTFENDTITISQEGEVMKFQLMTQEQIEAAEAANQEFGELLEDLSDTLN